MVDSPKTKPRGHRWRWVTYQGYFGYFKSVDGENK